jgi:stage III sporulation protein AC
MEITFLFKIAGIGFIVVILQQILSKSGREEIATLIVLASIIIIVIMLIPYVVDVIDELNSLLNL